MTLLVFQQLSQVLTATGILHYYHTHTRYSQPLTDPHAIEKADIGKRTLLYMINMRTRVHTFDHRVLHEARGAGCLGHIRGIIRPGREHIISVLRLERDNIK